MGYKIYPVDLLEKFCLDAFTRIGFKPEESQIITDVLLLSDKYGIESLALTACIR